jgi:DNA invertase Pin-like site-specific DNA recombinase
MRVALYARVSTLDKDQNPEVQLRELREYCSARNLRVSFELIDHGYSGANIQRPAYTELMRLARLRKVDCVVCWKMDRVGRSMKEMIFFLEEMTNLKILFVSLTEGIDFGSPAGRFMSHILISVASLERDLTIERTKAGLRNAVAMGKTLGRPPKHDPNKIIELRNSGKSYRQIVSELKCPLGVVSKVIANARKSGKISINKNDSFELKSGD